MRDLEGALADIRSQIAAGTAFRYGQILKTVSGQRPG
jgi:hypothetical protein